MEEFVGIVRDYRSVLVSIGIPLREVVVQENETSFERSEVNKRQNFLFLSRIIYYLTPQVLVGILSEQQIIYSIEKRGVIHLVNSAF